MPPLRRIPLDELKAGKAKLRIFLVGVNYYCNDTQFAPLNFAVKDCTELAKAFQIVTDGFRDSKQQPTTQIVSLVGLEDSPLNVDSITSKLDGLLQDVSPKDTVIFYFAGHGKIDKATGKFYLCLTDTTSDNLAGSGLDIQLFLNKLKQSGVRKQIILLDACHSGAGDLTARDRGATLIATPRSLDSIDPSQTASHTDPSSRLENIVQEFSTSDREFYAILSCGANQRSWECPNLKHGVFSHFLIQGLLNDVEPGSDGQLSISSLHEYVGNATEDYCRDELRPSQLQTPVCVTSGRGGHTLIVGMRQPASKRLKEEYRDLVRLILEQHYPDLDNSEELQAFRNACRAQFKEASGTRSSLLFNDNLELIENEVIHEFKQVLNQHIHYRKCATKHLFDSYPHGSDPFFKLRKEFEREFGTLVLDLAALQEKQAQDLFNQQKERYLEVTFTALHSFEQIEQTPEFSSMVVASLESLQIEIETELRELGIEVTFSAIAHSLLPEAINLLAEQTELYRELCSLCLRQPSLERDQEKSQLEYVLQHQYRFPEYKLMQIDREIEAIVKQDEESYESEYIRLLQEKDAES